MKAMVLKTYNQPMTLEEVEDPRPEDDEIVLRVKACGVCGTDLKIVSGMLPPPIVTLPHIPGHEIAGEVVAVGPAVEHVPVGQNGLAYFYLSCRDCEMCRTGRENLCISIKRLGFELPGGFAEYVKLPAYNFCPFGEGMAPERMAVLPDAMATSYHALKSIARVEVGQDVLIVGVGGLGIHAVQIAKFMGARVIAMDSRNTSLKLAKEFGADFTVNNREQDALEAVREITKGRGVDAVIDIVGSEETLPWSIQCLRRHGCLVVVGYVPGRPFQLYAMDLHYNEWTVCGSRVSTKQELLELIAMVEGGKLHPVVAKTFPWEEADQAIASLQQQEQSGRTVLMFS